MVFGVHPLIELLKAKKRKIYTLYTTKPEPRSLIQIKKYWPQYPVSIQYVKRDVLHKLAGTEDHQNLVALAAPLQINKKFFNPERHKNLVLLFAPSINNQDHDVVDNPYLQLPEHYSVHEEG